MEGRQFKITLPITGWVKRSESLAGIEGEWLVIRGWASDTSVDKLGGKMSDAAVVNMVRCVNNGVPTPVVNSGLARTSTGNSPVGIDIEHSDRWDDQIGYALNAQAVYELSADQQAMGMQAPAMYVECAIDLGMSKGRDLARALEKGVKLGMSIWGFVTDGKTVTGPNGKPISRFDMVDLQRIAMTQRPANPNMWLTEIARSMQGVEMDPEKANTQEAAPTEPAADPAPQAGVIAEGTQEAPGTEVTTEGVEAAEPVAETATPESPAPAPDPAAPTVPEATPQAEVALSIAQPGIAALDDDVPVFAAAKSVTPGLESLEMDGAIAATLAAQAAETVDGTVAKSIPTAPTAPSLKSTQSPADIEAVGTLEPDSDEDDGEDDENPAEEAAETPAQEAAEEGQEAGTMPAKMPGTMSAKKVARAITELEVFRSEFGQVREILGQLPAVMQELRDEVKRSQDENATLRTTIDDLEARLAGIEDAGRGRRGTQVLARALMQLEQDPTVPLGAELNPDQRLEVLGELARSNNPAAVNMLFGRLMPPQQPVGLPAEAEQK